jgi:hypothetical protein
MKDIFKEIKKQAAKGLIVRVVDLKNSSEHRSTFKVGDQIEFTLNVWNNSQFELSNLDFKIHEMAAVKLEQNQVNVQIGHLAVDERRSIATLNGKVIENPDDAGSMFGIKDYLCRVRIAGDINLSPVHFEDVELETINITDG